jgi:predicted nuclease of restriction endonuclease-like (RecB) superfamily
MSNEIIVHFQNLRSLIHEGKTRALQAANAYSIIARWNVGAYLSNSLTERAYGKNVVNEFAEWLVQQEPTLKGFDRRNLYRMRQFFELWQEIDWSLIPENANNHSILIGNSPDSPEQKIVVSLTPQSFQCPPVVTRITWGHHVEILNGATSPEERLFYLVLTIKDRYTVMELRRQIKSALFERQMLAKHTLIVPEHPKKEWFAEVFRDRYMIEFLELKDAYSEFELKKALILRMKQFLLELGRDFIFIDEELHLKVGMNDYFVDLVFYHRELQCLVAIDLKIDEFKPEYMGKMNFYLELLDRDVRKPHENPSIGMVLCKSKNDEVVEITMSRQLAPSLVAVYETKFLDKNLLRQLLHKWAEDWQENQK